MAMNKKFITRKILYGILLMLLLFSMASFGYGDEAHSQENKDQQVFSSMHGNTNHHNKMMINPLEFKESDAMFPFNILEDLKSFPSLHPLIVHFPIVLMLTVPFLYLMGLYFGKREFLLISVAMLWGGFISSLIAGTVMHPHTVNLSSAAQAALESHDFYAYLTIYVSGIASALGSLALLEKFRKRFLEIIVCGLAFVCLATISLTGHYGAQLTHIYGVGPQGQYLEDSH